MAEKTLAASDQQPTKKLYDAQRITLRACQAYTKKACAPEWRVAFNVQPLAFPVNRSKSLMRHKKYLYNSHYKNRLIGKYDCRDVSLVDP